MTVIMSREEAGHTVWERINLGIFALVAVDTAETCEGVLPINIHGTGAANPLPAGTAERQCGIYLVFYFYQCIKDLKGDV